VLLKDVVRGKFTFTPEDRWDHVSADAKQLITDLIKKDPTKRLTASQVKNHRWLTASIARLTADMSSAAATASSAAADAKDKANEVAPPKGQANVPEVMPLDTKAAEAKVEASPKSSLFSPRSPPIFNRMFRKGSAASSSGDTIKEASSKPAGGSSTEEDTVAPLNQDFGTYVSVGGTRRPKLNAMSRETQYWYALEISPPTATQKHGGISVGDDGKFVMDNIPEEMRAVLEEIEKKKSAREAKASKGFQLEISEPTIVKRQSGVTVGEDGKFVVQGSSNVPEGMQAMLEQIAREKAEKAGKKQGRRVELSYAPEQSQAPQLASQLSFHS